MIVAQGSAVSHVGCVSKGDAAPVPLLARAPPNTQSRCELPGTTVRPGSTAEGVGRCRRSWRLSRHRERKNKREKERETYPFGESEKFAFAATATPSPLLFVRRCSGEGSGAVPGLPVLPPSPRRHSEPQPARRIEIGGFGWGRFGDPPFMDDSVA
ncbi:hypothetical protein P4O66_022832 [Electrophorus voltai]|uniref:Uncharacterized protein n=1 Tax=Electrophorus voltai TaxID=2609070 RepID=A0AAD8ZMV5_9TELE|nr:hypothetical protein P4O66_022832 [Electrophorus voltai]